MKKVFIISVVFQLLCLGIQAHPEDLIVLKNGKIVQGYISSQIPGKHITLMSDNDDTPGFNIEDVAIIEQATRDKELIVGLVDVIETSRGPIKGQIFKRTLGERPSIFIMKDDGETEEVLNSEILTQKKEKLNKNYSLFSQSEFLDVVVPEDGESITGIITKQDFTGESPVLFLEQENGEQKEFKVNKITELRRKPNKGYTPIKEFHPEPGNYYFNKTVVSGVKSEKWKKDWTALNDDDVNNAQVINLTDDKLTIQTEDNATNRKCMLLEVQKAAAGKITRYAYSLADVEKGGIPYETTKQDGQEAEWTYIVKEGNYVLLVPGSDIVYIVNIVK